MNIYRINFLYCSKNLIKKGAEMYASKLAYMIYDAKNCNWEY